MTNIAELYAHTMAIAEGKAELASDILDIIGSVSLTDDERLDKIRRLSEKAVTNYEGLSRA